MKKKFIKPNVQIMTIDGIYGLLTANSNPQPPIEGEQEGAVGVKDSEFEFQWE